MREDGGSEGGGGESRRDCGKVVAAKAGDGREQQEVAAEWGGLRG